MFHFSFSSVLMTILMSNLMLVIIAMCFRSDSLMTHIGYKLLAVFCIVTLIRLLFPLELPFTQTYALPRTLSYIVAVFRHPLGAFLGIKLSLWTLFCVIWFVGAVVFLIRFAREHKTIRQFTGLIGQDVTDEEPYASILRELCSEKQLRRIRVVKMPGIKSPMIAGLRRPRILLPMDVDVSDEDTFYALKHEVYHYIHHDLWIKSAVKCLTIAYWWNPFTHWLNRQIDTLLEMRIDNAIMKKSPEEAYNYMLSIYRLLTGGDYAPEEGNQSSSLCHVGGGSLYRRLRMIQHQGKKKNYLISIGVFLLIVSMYIGSYLVILEANVYGSNVKGDQFATSKDNIYAIQNEDGSYDIYMTSGFFLETTDTLKSFPANITIYSSEEEYHEKNQ